jgi:prepilin-type processing-associated H-X9-DG protein
VQCLNNLRQLGTLHTVNVIDEGHFINYVWEELWMPRLLAASNAPYSPLGYCPKAPPTGDTVAPSTSQFGALWHPWQMDSWEGSFGFNGHLYRSISSEFLTRWALIPENQFNGESSIRFPTQTPVFFDSVWPDTWPHETDRPMANLLNPPSRPKGIQRAMVPRHGSAPGNGVLQNLDLKYNLPGAANMIFYDGHCEAVKLENLWTLQWHSRWTPPPVRPGK